MIPNCGFGIADFQITEIPNINLEQNHSMTKIPKSLQVFGFGHWLLKFDFLFVIWCLGFEI